MPYSTKHRQSAEVETPGTEHTIVLSAKSGQSDIWDRTYYSTKRKLTNFGGIKVRDFFNFKVNVANCVYELATTDVDAATARRQVQERKL